MKALGLQYEARVKKSIMARHPGALCGQWIEFADANGHGYAQPDIVLPVDGVVLVFECKLTETAQGREQIDVLYAPLLREIFSLPVRGIVVAKFLTRETQRDLVCGTLPGAMGLAARAVPTLHWLGKGAL